MNSLRGNVIAFILSFVLIGAAIVGSILNTAVSIQNNDRQWCHVLVTLTNQKPPPASSGNPSRIYANQLYHEFQELKGHFGC